MSVGVYYYASGEKCEGEWVDGKLVSKLGLVWVEEAPKVVVMPELAKEPVEEPIVREFERKPVTAKEESNGLVKASST